MQGSVDNIRIIVNVTYSYAIIGSAARSVQERQQWVPHATVSTLQFTNKWVKAFLNRGGLTRRKITRDDKDVPGDDEIAKILGVGQKLLLENRHDEHTCYNFDETAYTWGLAPIHSYCPKDQQRATNIGITDTKVRITAVIAVSAAGLFAPLMLILKHSKSSEKSPDQTKMTVINKLHKVEGFTERDGWTKHTWSKLLTLKGKEDEHKVTYIIHNVTKHVITSQVKAWNDTVRMIMWNELVVNPIQVELGRSVLLWCDNCGSHKTTSVQKVITEIGADVVFLPKNMTGELQVLDLVVNGPLKAHIRTNRANRLYSHFQKYRVARAADSTLPVNERKNLEFDPPKPTLVEGIKDLFLLFEGQMKEDRFKATIKRSFIKTGTFPTYHEDSSEPPTFAAYHKESTWGTMKCVPSGTLEYYNEENVDVIDENEDEGIVRAILAYHENQEMDDDDDNECDGDETESDEE